MLVVRNTDSVDDSPFAELEVKMGDCGNKIIARPGVKTVRMKASARVEQDRNKRPDKIPWVDRLIGRCDR